MFCQVEAELVTVLTLVFRKSVTDDGFFPPAFLSFRRFAASRFVLVAQLLILLFARIVTNSRSLAWRCADFSGSTEIARPGSCFDHRSGRIIAASFQ
jgi:hypothetical protein